VEVAPGHRVSKGSAETADEPSRIVAITSPEWGGGGPLSGTARQTPGRFPARDALVSRIEQTYAKGVGVKNLTGNLILGLACSACIQSPVLAAQSSDKEAITQIEERMAGPQSVENVLGSWDKDAVWYDITPGEVVGISEIRKDFAEQLSHLTNIRVKILRLHVDADSKLGYAFSTVHLAADGKGGAPGIDVVIRQTDTYRKRHGTWLLTHQQISLPVDLATGKAVFNSQ
jgi:ketosteroid isomerase-like protein